MGTTINGQMPISFYGVFANNAGTNSGHDDAWMIGTIVNKAKVPGSWELGYNYREVQANSATALNDSDFIDGGTGGKGHEFKAKYQILKNVQGA
ncbi:MAG: putative porin, partial [Planctomycetota bacterium]